MGRTVINIQEAIGKTVGRRKPPSDSLRAGLELQRTANDLCRAFGHRLHPRGVFRFHSHEEADRWMMANLRPNKARS
jgi:hypothetical protein